MLLAEIDSTTAAAIGTVIGTAGAGLVYAVFKGTVWVINAKHRNSGEVRQWTASEHQKIIDRQDRELAEVRQRTTNLETRLANTERDHNDCLRRHDRVTTWLQWAAPALRAANINVPDFDTVDHTPVPGALQ